MAAEAEAAREARAKVYILKVEQVDLYISFQANLGQYCGKTTESEFVAETAKESRILKDFPEAAWETK